METKYIPDSVLNQYREFGYKVTIVHYRDADYIEFENERGYTGYYFFSPASDPTRAEEIKRDNADHIEELNKGLAWEERMRGNG